MKIIKKAYRRILLILCDSFIIVTAYLLSFFICDVYKYYNDIPVFFIYLLFYILIIYIMVMNAFGIYKSIWRYAQMRESFICMIASFTAGTVFFITQYFLIAFLTLPPYFYVMFICIAATGHVTARYLYKSIITINTSTKPALKKTRVLVVGAGAAATSFIIESHQYKNCEYHPVAMVDDDLQKHGRKIAGVKVSGSIADIKSVCEKYDAELIIIAIPSATNADKARIIDYCTETNLVVKTLPYMTYIDDETILIQKVREISPEELLGREPIDITDENILSFINGQVVAVTGGGGSIGSELCLQIAAHSPKRLIIIDIYENNAYDLQQELKQKYGSELDFEVYIASVRDEARIDEILCFEKPEILIHAAAHKHVPLMEISPQEAVKNNIFGTLNTANAAMKAGVGRFILISTDKAVNPTNVMGATKRVCEMIIQSMNFQSKTVFAAVRFGNVLGSNGSVIPLFNRQIHNNGPVTVTHPDINRFFMTIPEAAQLVLTAGAMAYGGEIFILDMGNPVKIVDLAKKMIQLSGKKNIEIVYTGLRPGEKLYEELLLSEEGINKTDNKKIYIGNQNGISRELLIGQLDRLKKLINVNPPDINFKIDKMLTEITGTFHRTNYDIIASRSEKVIS
ncbi:MAG: polysaccharide biosynthesis protein [Eubacteriales bacterium]